MPFGVLLLGPPGSGKSTLTAALVAAARADGREVAAVNLDPANDAPPYAAAVDVTALIASADAAAAFGLGPNGALLYALDFLAANADWLARALAPALARGAFVIIDAPGQAELYTAHDGLARVVRALGARGTDLRLAAVHLVDAHHAADPAKFVAAALLALQAMVRLELPHVNVLSKADQTHFFDAAPYGIESFTDFLDVRALLPGSDDDEAGVEGGAGSDAGVGGGGGEAGAGAGSDSDGLPPIASLIQRTAGGGLAAPRAALARLAPRSAAFLSKFRRLNAALAEVINDYNLISFVPVSAGDAESVRALLATVDKAIGFVRTSAPAE